MTSHPKKRSVRTISSAIGRGGTSVVYEARHRTLGRRVALKVLNARGSTLRNPKLATERFLREGRAAAAVQHPHVVDVFDSGIDAGAMYLAMELVAGPTLAELLAREGPLPYTRAVSLLLPIVAAIAELHAAGVVHRDLKPANILLSKGPDGAVVPKVADFGLSRVDDDGPSLTESGAILGTLAYMAPEQLRGAGAADERSDQYALGVVLYECLTRELPFDGTTAYERMHATVTRTARAPRAIAPGVPSGLDAVVMRALHRDPAERFDSVDALGAALLRFAPSDVRTRWQSELGDAEEAPPKPRRRTVVTLAAAGALAIVSVVAGRYVLERKPRATLGPASVVVREEARKREAPAHATLREDEPSATSDTNETREPSAPKPASATSATSASSATGHASATSASSPAPRAPAASVAKAPSARAVSSARESGDNDSPIIDPD